MMRSVELVKQLEKDFIFEELSDDWARYMPELNDYLSTNFKERSMGVVCDFANEITQVFTAVFPTNEIMQKIIEKDITDAMLFVHHPSIWDIRRPQPFYQMDQALLDQFRERRIAIYNLHVPLDNYGEYSTSKTLADALNIKIETPFVHYRGSLCGVVGKTACKNIDELQHLLSAALGHPVKLYRYGAGNIKDGRIGIVAGGGNMLDTVSEMIENNLHVLITGISSNSEAYSEVHEYERKNHINVLGGTHYSTEKFACQKMCTYFERLGLSASFLEGEPVLEDM